MLEPDPWAPRPSPCAPTSWGTRSSVSSWPTAASAPVPMRTPRPCRSPPHNDSSFRRVQSDEVHVAYTETRYTQDAVVPPDTIERVLAVPRAPIVHHRRRVPCEVLTCELTGIPVPAAGYLTLDYLRRLELSTRYPTTVPAAQRIPVDAIDYHALPTRGRAGGDPVEKRAVEYVRTLFRKHDTLDLQCAECRTAARVPGPAGAQVTRTTRWP